MRSRLFRGLAASLLAVGVILPGTAQPARADTADTVVTVSFTVFKIIRGGLTAEQVETLVREAVNAVNKAKNEVIERIDHGEAAKAKAAAKNVSIQFLSYDVIRRDFLSLYFFFTYASDRALLDTYNLDVVQNKQAADQIGHALNVHYPIVLQASHDLGMYPSRDAYLQEYRAANQKLLQKLQPVCRATPLPSDNPFIQETLHVCTAANNENASFLERWEFGRQVSGPVNINALMEQAARNSSWLVAKKVLAQP